ncbi:hypothetical protein ACFYYH_34125 [Streptomyces sp. NPDC002018]|uniref:hypothetical protein n=1 Tax=Streptomyces sp. NPDC002018 TaxID=3364629 RepID=UPI00367AFBD4
MYYWFYTSSGDLDYRLFDCARRHNLNSRGYALDVGAWSGYVHFADGRRAYFCDGWLLDLNGRHVVGVEMAETRIPECGKPTSTADQDSRSTDDLRLDVARQQP